MVIYKIAHVKWIFILYFTREMKNECKISEKIVAEYLH